MSRIINKVIDNSNANSEMLLDLTEDTVNESNLLLNETAHNREGEPIRGTHISGGAVNSVNGKTGDVVLNANDVGALPSNTPIPSKTSDLTNDSGYVTASILPIGGTTGQVLAKKSNSDYDMKWVNQSGSGGHTILNESGTEMPQRSKLQFEGCEVTDDSTNDITKIKAEGSVTGVKGNAETDYRTGNVNLTPANIGALATDGDSKDNTVTFTSSDNDATTEKTSDGFTSVATMASGESHSSLFQKISKMFLNIRKLWNTVGSTAIDTAYGTTLTAQMANLKTYNTYSTSETWTGKYYVDSNNVEKKIYSKIIRGTFPSSGNEKLIDSTLTNSAVKIFNAWGTISNSSGGVYVIGYGYGSIYASSSAEYVARAFGLVHLSTGLRLDKTGYSNGDVNNQPYEVTVEYTKTT